MTNTSCTENIRLFLPYPEKTELCFPIMTLQVSDSNTTVSEHEIVLISKSESMHSNSLLAVAILQTCISRNRVTGSPIVLSHMHTRIAKCFLLLLLLSSRRTDKGNAWHN